MKNHRRENRLQVDLLGLTGHIYSGLDSNSTPCMISDVSPTGIGILITSKNPPAGKIALSLDGSKGFAHAGEICWVHQEARGQYRVGIGMDPNIISEAITKIRC